MNFTITFLGTAASQPTVFRGLPSLFIRDKHGIGTLIDCGEGTSRSLLQYKIGYDIQHLLFTHGHLDHVGGIAGLVGSIAGMDIPLPLMFGADRTLERVLNITKYSIDNKYSSLLKLNQLSDGMLVYRNKDVSCFSFNTQHRGLGNMGFKFMIKESRPFDNEKANALGVPFDNSRKFLMEGQNIRVNGKTISPEDVLGELIPAMKVVVLGDVSEYKTISSEIEDSFALVTEATFMEVDREIAVKKSHSCVEDAARASLENNIKNVIFTHVSGRYRTKDIIKTCHNISPNTNFYVAEDGDKFTITKNEITTP